MWSIGLFLAHDTFSGPFYTGSITNDVMLRLGDRAVKNMKALQKLLRFQS